MSGGSLVWVEYSLELPCVLTLLMGSLLMGSLLMESLLMGIDGCPPWLSSSSVSGRCPLCGT